MKFIAFWLAALTLVSAASISLTLPADNQVIGSPVTFTFSPTAEAGFEHCTLFSNKTGAWALTQANQSVVLNASSNTLSHAFSDGSILWQITCSANLTEFSSVNRTVRIDTTAPVSVTNLSATTSGLQVNVSWNASSDATALFYAVNRNNTWIANTTASHYLDSVSAGQSYLYAIRAVDQANLSSTAVSTVYTVPSASPTPAPLTLSNIALALSSSSNLSSATFAWNITGTAANASISYGNGTSLFGVVSNPTLLATQTLTVAGLAPMRSYVANITSCNATACGYNTSLAFFTLPSSIPSATTHTANSSVGGTWVLFTVPWTDAAGLSYYVFSSNATGSFVNTTPVAFSGSTATHSLLLNSNAHTLAWIMWANNTQGAWGATQTWLHGVSALPTVTPTPLPTVPPQLVNTPVPTAPPAATPSPVPALSAPSISPTPTPAPAVSVSASSTEPVNNRTDSLNGTMNEFVLISPENATLALLPTGLVIGVDTEQAPLRFSTNFTNLGIPAEILFIVNLTGPDVSLTVSSPMLNVTSGEAVILQTKAADLPPGTYQAFGSVVDSSGKVLDTKALVVNVESSATSAESAALAGLMVALLGVSVLILFQLQSALHLKDAA